MAGMANAPGIRPGVWHFNGVSTPETANPAQGGAAYRLKIRKTLCGGLFFLHLYRLVKWE
jgi:hypothetical protein